MRRLGPRIFLFSLILAAIMMLACGSSTSAPRTLQTVNVNPASAESQAQFTALGFYTPPYPAPVVLTATWGACYQNAPTTQVTVTSSGFAQCGSGASGTYTVFASKLTQCNAITACGGGCQVTGFATLTCP
jgi:hypothetical protein